MRLDEEDVAALRAWIARRALEKGPHPQPSAVPSSGCASSLDEELEREPDLARSAGSDTNISSPIMGRGHGTLQTWLMGWMPIVRPSMVTTPGLVGRLASSRACHRDASKVGWRPERRRGSWDPSGGGVRGRPCRVHGDCGKSPRTVGHVTGEQSPRLALRRLSIVSSVAPESDWHPLCSAWWRRSTLSRRLPALLLIGVAVALVYWLQLSGPGRSGGGVGLPDEDSAGTPRLVGSGRRSSTAVTDSPHTVSQTGRVVDANRSPVAGALSGPRLKTGTQRRASSSLVEQTRMGPTPSRR